MLISKFTIANPKQANMRMEIENKHKIKNIIEIHLLIEVEKEKGAKQPLLIKQSHTSRNIRGSR